MLNLNSLMIGTMQVPVMAKFYEQVVGRTADMIEGNWYGWKVGTTFLSIGEHSQMSGMAKDAGRIMFNFETEQVKQEFDRIKALGATVVAAPYEMGGAWIATLADPDGNYFQLMTPWKE